MRKRDEGQSETQDFPVFCYLCSSIGETLDSYRFDIDDNDLHNAVENYNAFKNAKSNEKIIEMINSDKRAKLLDISKFDTKEQWNIERFWTEEEKIDLGIMAKREIVSLDEFSNMLLELSTDVRNYAELLKELK